MSTISSTVSSEVQLGKSGNTSPLTISTSGVVIVSGFDAVYAAGTYANPVVVNQGLIQGYDGIFFNAAGTVTNSGTIVGTGSHGPGVFLNAGGSVGNTAGLIEGASAIVISGTAGTVTNSGALVGTVAFGVELSAGGSVNNADVIQGTLDGVYIQRTAGAVTNSGTIVGDEGVFLYVGGGVVNNPGGLIQGAFQGILMGPVLGTAVVAGTVTNAGTITQTAAQGQGIYLFQGGSVGNTGLIQGDGGGVYIKNATGTVTNSGAIAGTTGSGVDLLAGGTIVDSGTISGGGGTAISFGGTGSNFLILEHGYKLTGGVYGTVAATNTLELGGTVNAAVTVGYNTLSLANFSDVLFGASANNTLKVSNTSGTLPVTISGFTLTSDIIDLTAIGTNGTITQSSTEVTVTGSLGTESLKLDSSDATHFTVTSDGVLGTDLGVACFGRGTRILTERGQVAVEDLVIGDRVITVSGAARPIKWIGRRAYDGRFVAAKRAVLPIQVEAGALTEGMPARDLWVSPEHALYLHEFLVPAGLLVNGATIRQVEGVEHVEYFHIELDSHDVIFAEGVAAETFVDCDNRFMFQNGAEYALLYPDDAPVPWEFCAPRLEWGEDRLVAIRAALLRRAEALGYRRDDDADLHLVVDGARIAPDAVEGLVHRFSIPAGGAAVSLASRSAVPAELDAASRDLRRLGVAVERIVLRDGALAIALSYDHPLLCDGFHAAEAGHRWTDGLARLPEALLGFYEGSLTVEIHVASTTLVYRLSAADRAAA